MEYALIGKEISDKPTPPCRNRLICCLLILIILFSALLLTWDISGQWVGNRDSVGAVFGGIAKNYIKYGYVATRFGMVTERLPDGEFHYYLSHPPLLSILISFSYRIFGIHEWSTRLVPILFSMGSIVLFFIFAFNIAGLYYALLCICLLVPLPMFAYFGRLPTFEPLISFFSLACLIFYLKWSECGRLKYYFGMTIFLFITCMIDWPGYFLSLSILLHFYIKNRKLNRSIVGLLAVDAFAALLYLGHIFILTGMDGIISMFNRFLYRSGMASVEKNTNIFSAFHYIGISFFEFIYLHVYRSILYFTVGLIILALFWVIYSLKNRTGKDSILWCIFGMSFLNVCIFANASLYHDFWEFYFSYFFAGAAAFGVLLLWFSGSNKKRVMVVFLLSIFIIQSVWLLNRRHQQNMGYPLDIPLAMTLKENVNPETYVCTSFAVIPDFASYYADDFISGNIRNKKRFIASNAHNVCKYFITASPDDIRSHIDFYSRFSSEDLENLGTLSDSNDFLLYLKKEYPYKELNGFLLFKLK